MSAPLSAHYPFKDYHYSGPDVRDMSKQETNKHQKRWQSFMKDRYPDSDEE